MSYSIIKTQLSEVLILEPKIYEDDRGFFFESYHEKKFCQTVGLDIKFVQDNHSKSVRGVLRGLHYQIEHPQGKLIRVTQGAIFDVAVDIRKSSSSFGKWVGVELSEDNKRLLWVPAGFAHGFITISDTAHVLYKTTDYRYPEHERILIWSDPSLNIEWPVSSNLIIGKKDLEGKFLKDLDVFM